jgi:hypothetical protein
MLLLATNHRVEPYVHERGRASLALTTEVSAYYGWRIKDAATRLAG